MIAYRINAAGVSDKGMVRSANEDSMVLRNDAGLWAVADGMGGHANGKWASEQVVTALTVAPLEGVFDDDVRAIAAAIQYANGRILENAADAGAIMGSTVAILLLSESRFAVLWAGDSRGYLYRDRSLVRLTTDHTYVNDMVASGAITPEESRSHPNAHVISRAVGVDANLALDAVADEVRALDTFLLCSDGLTGLIGDAEIADHLDHNAPRTAARSLVDIVLSRGAPDNVTVIIVSCEETTQLSVAAPEVCDV